MSDDPSQCVCPFCKQKYGDPDFDTGMQHFPNDWDLNRI